MIEKLKNELKVFHNQDVLGKDFNVYGDVDNPLFLAKDVAEWIEYSKTSQGYYNVSKMLMSVDEDEKLTITNGNSGGKKTFLTEDGLYEVLMQSRKPIAKQFKKKVKEILKQIRQTGGYIPVSAEESDEEFLARALLVAQKTLEKKDKLIEQQRKTIEIQAPKVEMYDEFMESDGTYTPTKLGKKLGFRSAQAFNNFLAENNLIFKDKRTGEWIAKAHLPSDTHKYISQPFNKGGQRCYKEVLRYLPKMIEYLVDEEFVEL